MPILKQNRMKFGLIAAILIATTIGAVCLGLHLARPSLKEDKLPVATDGSYDLDRKILVFFRPNCSDCIAVYHEMKAHVEELKREYPNRVFCVNSKNLEAEVKERYNLLVVPSAGYIPSKGLPVCYPLYITDEDGPKWDESAWQRIEQEIKEDDERSTQQQ